MAKKVVSPQKNEVRLTRRNVYELVDVIQDRLRDCTEAERRRIAACLLLRNSDNGVHAANSLRISSHIFGDDGRKTSKNDSQDANPINTTKERKRR